MGIQSKDWQYAEGVWIDGSKKHLNSTLPINNPSAGSEFSYLSTDGSDSAGYLPAAGGAPDNAVTFGGDQLTWGGDPVTYGA